MGHLRGVRPVEHCLPLDERWEAIEDCERRFRSTKIRFSTDNIGLAYLSEGLALIRIGPALKPEIAAWRYGRLLGRWLPGARRDPFLRVARRWAGRGEAAMDSTFRRMFGVHLGYDLTTWLRVHGQADRILVAARGDNGGLVVIRSARPRSHRADSPRSAGAVAAAGDLSQRGHHRFGRCWPPCRRKASRGAEWRGRQRSRGPLRRDQARGRRQSRELLGPGGRHRHALLVGQVSRRAPSSEPIEEAPTSEAERLALQITKRSFWGRGGIGSEPRTPLPRLPLVDRLALEMAANEDVERRALEGELSLLESAWKGAEAIAAIADRLFLDRSRAQPLPAAG